MLLRRAVTWKAVGLTAAAASAAARNRSSCAGGSRPRQGGICKPTALSRQESQECRYELPATGCSGRTDLPPRDPGRHKQAWTTDPTHEHADGSGQVDESEDVPPTTGIWNISTLSTRQGWHRYIHRHAGSTDDKGACKKEPQDETQSQAGQPSEPGGGRGPTPPGQPNKDGPAGKGPHEKESVPLAMAPACCGCTRNGVVALKHERPIDEATFKTKPVDQEATLLLGLCLAPWTSGSILGMDGRVCGHVPCPACTVVHEGQTM